MMSHMCKVNFKVQYSEQKQTCALLVVGLPKLVSILCSMTSNIAGL